MAAIKGKGELDVQETNQDQLVDQWRGDDTEPLAFCRSSKRVGNTAEYLRLLSSIHRKSDYKNWGPYLSERAWGTVREDYSDNGAAWNFFPHDHARSRTYRWNEDGLGGFCNRFQNLCFSVALWNERDPILKERLYGVTGEEGNHGEDVKEYYFYLDSTPSHSYCKMLYKYPIDEYPYNDLIRGNKSRSRFEPEYELIDSLRDSLHAGRYFDVFIEYAKVTDNDILCRITAHNRSSVEAPLQLLPHAWFRNTWSWEEGAPRPAASQVSATHVALKHRHLGDTHWYVQTADGSSPQAFLFTENETNTEKVFGVPNDHPFKKDGINNFVVNGDSSGVRSERTGTKVAGQFRSVVAPGGKLEVWTRYTSTATSTPFSSFEATFALRIGEANDFFSALHAGSLPTDLAAIQRQAFAGLLWSKQFFHYSVQLWLDGDGKGPAPPEARKDARNGGWRHLYANDVLSMPDKWEYPWFAAWDLAFHCVPLAMVDTEVAKRQLIILLREWYMHPNGQIPAYEWNFSDVNPPVHAWAALQVYHMEKTDVGIADRDFLERIFLKLLLNFTWWVNRKDVDGKNVFQGGFLGLDNIGVFDRSAPLPTGGYLEQSDGTAWMGMYCLNMLAIALELAKEKVAYEDVATKFFEHFIHITQAMYDVGSKGRSLWNEEDGFFYDMLNYGDGGFVPLKIRSMVGLVPLFAVCAVDAETLSHVPNFGKRVDWFIKYRPELVRHMPSMATQADGSRFLSMTCPRKLTKILHFMLDEEEFLSTFGIRALSRFHRDTPFTFDVNGTQFRVGYEPAESTSGLFGGNSNWRGPIWMPMNYMIVEALREHHTQYQDSLKVECPVGSGAMMSLGEVADLLSSRLISIFTVNEKGERPVFGGEELFHRDPNWKDYVPFYEYFHGDNGAGIGASHQTGWTALVAKLIDDIHY